MAASIVLVEKNIGAARSGGATPLTADAARAQLTTLIEARSHASVDDPFPLLASPLPDPELRDSLIRLRAAILTRFSDEALEEMQELNSVLQLAQLRNQP